VTGMRLPPLRGEVVGGRESKTVKGKKKQGEPGLIATVPKKRLEKGIHHSGGSRETL